MLTYFPRTYGHLWSFIFGLLKTTIPSRQNNIVAVMRSISSFLKTLSEGFQLDIYIWNTMH